MNSEIIIGSFLGFAGGLIASSVGAYAAHRFAIDRDRRKEFQEAATQFREAFLEEIRALQKARIFDVAIDSDGDRVYDILERGIVRHEKAKIRFKPFLRNCDRTRFEVAWKEYYSEGEANYHLCDYQGEQDPKSGKIRINLEIKLMELALAQIHRLLSFADPTKI